MAAIISDRHEPIHHLGPGAGALLTLGGRLYVVEIGAGIPLAGLPGGMLIGRLRGESAAPFARNFGQRRDDEEARIVVPDGWICRMSLQGAAAAKDITSCMAEIGMGSSIR